MRKSLVLLAVELLVMVLASGCLGHRRHGVVASSVHAGAVIAGVEVARAFTGPPPSWDVIDCGNNNVCSGVRGKYYGECIRERNRVCAQRQRQRERDFISLARAQGRADAGNCNLFPFRFGYGVKGNEAYWRARLQEEERRRRVADAAERQAARSMGRASGYWNLRFK